MSGRPNSAEEGRRAGRALATLGALFLAVLTAAGGLTTACAEEPLYHLPPIETHRLDSRFIDQTYEIHVMLPVSRVGGSERFPVLYMTDSNGGVMLPQITRYMQMAGELPRFIVVGIGYPVDNLYASLYLRQRDLTPRPGERADYGIPLVGLERVKSGKTSGGGPEFLKFIREQLIPFIDAHYTTIPGDNAYFGHSLGGLFGLYVLFNAPETFNRYVIGSPALWWSDEAIFEDARDFLAGHEAVAAKVYMAIGGAEERARPDTHWVSNFYRMDALLRSKPIEGLSITTEMFPDTGHVAVFSMVHSSGLRAVYGPAPCSPFAPGCGQPPQ